MSDQTTDIQELIGSLERLKDRVHELDARVAEESSDPAAASGAARDPMVLLRTSVAELDGVLKATEVPTIFTRFAARSGLRLLVLKRWRSGLQVVAERNITMPVEAKQKLPSGKAPIPCDSEQIFDVVGRERQVYAGPVPVKAFPLDLTMMMGRGAQNRRIVILPLPARERWSNFIYIDGDESQAAAISVAEFLARHAVDRLRLMQLGDAPAEGEVATMLKHELHRRQERPATGATPGRAPEPPSLGPRVPRQSLPPEDELDVEWLSKGKETTPEPDPTDASPEFEPLTLDPNDPVRSAVPRTARVASQARAEADAIVRAWEDAVLGSPPTLARTSELSSLPVAPMAPEDILHQSGDLPAMPKAALRILSVIEDPHTTATRLEKAVAMDQTLTAKILRIANSPFYGAVREIKTVSEAIVRLGFVTIRNWTLVTATKSVFLGAGAGLLYQKIWRQSVLTAMASQLVAQTVRKAEPETVFVGGLMQNIGQLVLARSQPELFHQVLSISAEEHLPYYVVEQELLGFDHGDLGALLIKEWNLSEDLEQAVRWHHRLEHPDIVCADLAAMVALGEELAACSGSEETEDDFEPPQELSAAARHLGLSADGVDRLRRQARELTIDPGLFA